MDKQLATISIVSYNSRDLFLTLDNLLFELKNDSRFRIVVYDNGSEKNYQRKLQTYQEKIEIIFNEENEGFGHGHNEVLLQSHTPYSIVFNPDILVTKTAILEMIAHLEKQTDAVAIAPKVLNEDGSTQHLVRKRLTVWDYFLRFIPNRYLTRKSQQRLADYECRDLSETEISTVKMASGCFLIMKTPVFKKVNGFDERFFLYFEDNDLSLRIGQYGKILYTPFQTVTHLYARDSHKDKRAFLLFIKSMTQFFNKWGWELY